MTARMINFVSWLNSNPNNIRTLKVAFTLAMTLAAAAGIGGMSMDGSAPGDTDPN